MGTSRCLRGLLVISLVVGPGACRSRAKPGAGRTLTVLSPGVPDRFDPTQDPRGSARSIFFNVFEPLVRIDSTGRLVPCLADSWTNPSPEVYSFHLRPGVRFHDGAPLEAEHVVASFTAAQAPSSVIAGSLADVVEVAAPDPHSVEVKTRIPTAVLLQALTAVPITKPGRSGLAVGTGPFEAAEFRAGESVRLRRFPGYYGGRPLLEEVGFERFRTPDEALEALKDPRPVLVLTPPKEVVAAAWHDQRFRVVSETSGSLVYLAFNLHQDATTAVGSKRNPFLDVRVRRAFRLALDLETLIKAATPMGGLPATQLIPPGVAGFDSRLRRPKRDLDRARSLLREAGFPRGFGVVLDVRQDDRSLGESLARQIGELGVSVDPSPLTNEEFLKKRNEGRSSLYAYNWVVGEDSGQALKNFFHTKDPDRRLGLRNLTGYSNSSVDAAIEESLATLEWEHRLALLYKAMDLLMQDLPWIPLYAEKTIRIYPRDLDFPTRLDGLLVLSEAKAIGRQVP